MSTETRITVDGVPVDPDQPLADAIATAERHPADRYLIVRGGKPEAEIMWDGVAEFDPGDGAELVRTTEWEGDPWTGPPEPADVTAKRTQDERLQTIRRQLTDDLATVDTATIGQLRAIVRRVIRAERILIRVALAEPADTTADLEA